MRIKVKREFFIQISSQSVKRIVPGVYSVPEELDQNTADKVLKWGSAEVVPEKKAPENKIVQVAENKSEVGGSAGNSGSAGTKPKAKRGRPRKKVKVEDAGSTG
jgi:hypothetical protein